MDMLKVAFNPVGCKLNQYEVQSFAETLEPYGFCQVPFDKKADLYVINTCTVTGRADYTSRQAIRRALKKNPAAGVIVTGCYAELDPQALKSIDKRVVVIGNNQKDNLPELVLDLFNLNRDKTLPLKNISRMNGHSRAFIKIQEGCMEKCTYCVIWKVRGKPRSRQPESIVEEINKLYDNGYNEVVLTGVHIGRYRNRINFAGLLQHILSNTDMPRIRLSSLKPNEFKDELIDLIAAEKRICPHVHLPVQSGDDEILKRMGRKYSSQSVSKLANRLLAARPDITVGADFIVGFPGETEENFANSYNLVKNNPIHYLHVFSYSDRPGTVASAFAGKVKPEIKASRSNRLRRLGSAKKQEHLRKFIGRELDVIVENHIEEGMLTGVSSNYIKVKFRGDSVLQKKHLTLNINKAERDMLLGDGASVKFPKNG
jgi:threonylcarbamoyladenosine tRNA methylthiotransferase MtaB